MDSEDLENMSFDSDGKPKRKAKVFKLLAP